MNSECLTIEDGIKLDLSIVGMPVPSMVLNNLFCKSLSPRLSCGLFGKTIISCRGYRYYNDVIGYKNSANIQYDGAVDEKLEYVPSVKSLVKAFQKNGHKVADLYPLKNVVPPVVQSLNPEFHGLDVNAKVAAG